MPDTTERMSLEEALAESAKLRAVTGRRRENPEEEEQIALFDWVRRWEEKYPLLRRVRADRAGVNVSSAIARIKMKRCGGRVGVWDCFCDIVRLQGHTDGDRTTVVAKGGLYIEMKSKTGRLTDDQKDFQLEREGEFEFAVCRSWQEAAVAIRAYLSSIEGRYALLPIDDDHK